VSITYEVVGGDLKAHRSNAAALSAASSSRPRSLQQHVASRHRMHDRLAGSSTTTPSGPPPATQPDVDPDLD
jgi:hypothetical protein